MQTGTNDSREKLARGGLQAKASSSQHSLFAKSWADFVAGGIGAATAATLTMPLDVLRTRLQSDYYQAHLSSMRAARNIPPPSSMSFARSSLLHFRETFQILFAIPRAEGKRALFKGLGPTLIGVVPARSINFFTYTNTKRLLSSEFNSGRDSALVQLPAAVVAGLVTGTATNPIWLVRTRLQLDKSKAQHGGERRYRNALDCTIKTVRAEGIRGLYKGLSASYLGVSEGALQWMLYERMKEMNRKRKARLAISKPQPSSWDDALSKTIDVGAAGAAKFIATAITYPHEVVRTRLRQAPVENGLPKYTGLVQCFKLVFKQEGAAGMYAGMTAHMLRVVPNAAIMFGTWESVLLLLGTTSKI